MNIPAQRGTDLRSAIAMQDAALAECREGHERMNAFIRENPLLRKIVGFMAEDGHAGARDVLSAPKRGDD